MRHHHPCTKAARLSLLNPSSPRERVWNCQELQHPCVNNETRTDAAAPPTSQNATHCAPPAVSQVRVDLDRDNFFSAQEALAYGMIDRVIETTKI